jgi:hypothetical protein
LGRLLHFVARVICGGEDLKPLKKNTAPLF